MIDFSSYTFATQSESICIFGIPGCNCLGAQVGLPVEQPVFTLADLGLSDEEIAFLGLGLDDAEYLGDEAESELARVIGEVRVGNFLTNEEGDTLVQALVEEEQDHANTLADLGDAEDRIAELEGELLTRDETLALAAEEITSLRAALALANVGLELAADTLIRADSAMSAGSAYIRLLEGRIFELEMTNRARVVYATLFI